MWHGDTFAKFNFATDQNLQNLDTQNFPIYYANSFKLSCELTLQDFYKHPLIIIRSLMPLESYNLEAILGHNTKKKEKEAVKD